jgi:hypothetical protein
VIRLDRIPQRLLSNRHLIRPVVRNDLPLEIRLEEKRNRIRSVVIASCVVVVTALAMFFVIR